MLETAFNIDTSSIKFGSGVTREILYEINRLSINKLLNITDRNVIDLPVSQFVIDELSKSTGLAGVSMIIDFLVLLQVTKKELLENPEIN